MAIRMMVNEDMAGQENVEQTTYPGYDGVLYMQTTHQGMVLSTGERNGYDDSDFYANVWDEATQSIKQVEYATTRGWTYPNGASVDASPEVQAKAAAWVAEQKRVIEAATVRVGKTVQVVRGRKLPIGTVADVFWMGPDKYKKYGKRVGLRLLDGTKVFIDAANVVTTAA